MKRDRILKLRVTDDDLERLDFIVAYINKKDIRKTDRSKVVRSLILVRYLDIIDRNCNY